MRSPSVAALDSAWFALRVRTRSEDMVKSLLQAKGYPSYSPTYVSERQYSDRIKRVEMSLFPGYVFCRFSRSEILPILTTPAVQSVVGVGPRPEPIADAEIERLQSGVRYGHAVAPHVYMRAGQMVQVRSGPLSGIIGFLVDIRNNCRLIITTDILQRAVSLEIDAHDVVPV